MSSQIIIEEEYDAGEDLPEFNEAESYYHDIDYGSYCLTPIFCKDLKFALIYSFPHFEEGTLFPDYYILRVSDYCLYLHRTYIEFESNKTNGKIHFDINLKLGDLVDIKNSPIDLELTYDGDRGKAIDNIIVGEDIDIDVDLEKIEKKLRRFEVLRLFL